MRPLDLEVLESRVGSFFLCFKNFFYSFVLLHPWHREVPGPVFKLATPETSQIINSLCHSGNSKGSVLVFN